MSRSEQIAFNLLFNSTCSFMAGLLIVSAVVRLFRVGNGGWKLFLLSLPFVKIVWDVAGGIPASSVIFAGINPLSLPPKHQTLTLGAGLSEFGPLLSLVFTSNDLAGNAHSTSLADYLAAFLIVITPTAQWSAPRVVLLVVLGVSALLVVRRAYLAIQFETRRSAQRSDDQGLRRVKVGRRTVDIYRSSAYAGTPFTGGVFSPYICFPERTFQALSEPEREAVIHHEIAHIRRWDLVAALAIKVLGDLFWFVPLYRALSRKIDRLRELLADQVAVRSGASGVHLASALLKLKELPAGSQPHILYSAFFRETALLAVRVSELLDPAPHKASRLGWNKRLTRVVIVLWTTGAVILATFGGNHQIKNDPLPHWLERWVEMLK